LANLKRIAESQAGFTLMELMFVTALMGILLTLGAFAVRHFWSVRSLQGAQDTVVTQLRQVQQRSFSENHPSVYGVRFLKGTSDFGVVRYDYGTSACSVVNSQQLGDGVQIVNDAETDFPDVANLTTACRNATPNASANYEVVFFYARGSTNASATVGSVKLSQPKISRTNKVVVSPLTGRVTRV
jgi:prepilin-type N-terminal cleavage/methylation domain-containing protein